MSIFKDEHTIEVMLSKHIKGKAPIDWQATDWKQFYKTFTPTRLTPYQLAAMIWQGFSFTPVYKNGRRKEENFTAAWHMAFDFDDEGADLGHLMQNGGTANLFASFAYSTPSSTAKHPKSRVVFVFDYPLETPEQTRELYQAIAWRFEREGSKTDPSCKDPLRLYYGSPDCTVVPNWSVVTNTSEDEERPSMVDFFIDEYKAANPPPPEPPKNNTVMTLPADGRYISQRIDKLLDNVTYAPDGQKHNTLNTSAFVLGGFVASGYIGRFDAISKLEAAIRSNGRAKDLKAARATIEAAVDDGMAKPITIEQSYKMDLDQLL